MMGSVLDSVLGDHEHRLSLGEVGRVDQSCDPLSGLTLPEVDTECGRVTDDVSTDGPGGVSEERVGFRRDLVGDGDDRVVHGGEVEQVVHVAVEDLLPLRECTPSDVLRPEV